jgi:hypothetical protein
MCENPKARSPALAINVRPNAIDEAVMRHWAPVERQRRQDLELASRRMHPAPIDSQRSRGEAEVGRRVSLTDSIERRRP